MLKKSIATITIISLCLLVVLLNSTTPSWPGPLGVLAVFIFAYLSSLGLVAYLIYWSSRLFAYISSHFTSRKPLLALDLKRSYYFATVLAVAPVIFVGLQSVGNVGLYEILLVFIFVILGVFYISKRAK
ncbi:MAG: hypothetical protein WCP03_03605 [Candidatus Saccharibacteria bacterium]